MSSVRAALCSQLCAVAFGFTALIGCTQPTTADKPADQAQKAAALTDPKAIVEAAADPCAAAKGLFLTSLCGDPALKDLTDQIKSVLMAEADGADVASATTLRDGQQSWIAATRTFCSVDDAAGVLSDQQRGCIKAQLQARAKEAAELIDSQGGYVFQRVEMNQAMKAQATAQSGPATPLDDLPITKEIDYPRLNAATPQATAFNELMRATVARLRPPPGENATQTTEAIRYEIAFAGPDLISVMFESSQMTPGAANPDNSTRVVNVLMGTGRELAPADIFAAPDAQWQADLVRRATAGLRRQLRDLRGVELNQADIRDTITKPHNWRITERALVLVFPPNSVGPAQLGVIPVEIAWKDIKALLRKDAPAPVRQS